MRVLSGTVVVLTLTATMLFVGCGEKSGKSKSAQPAKQGEVKSTKNLGAHGGHKFHFHDNHKVLAELLVKDGKIAIYVIDHNSPDKTVEAKDKEIIISNLKHDGKDIPPIKLIAMKKEGETWFEASGDAVPKEVIEAHHLNGGTFSVNVVGETLKATIREDEEKHEEHSGYDND